MLLTLMTLVANYWWVAGIVILAGGYALARKYATPKAKAFIDEYLGKLEKDVFTRGDVGIGVLADQVYQALPTRVRLFVPRLIFDNLVVDAYRAAKKAINAEGAPVAPQGASATPVAPQASVAPVTSPDVAKTPVATATPATPVDASPTSK